jgi:hypothetical protein
MSRFTDHARLAVAVVLAAVSLALMSDVSTSPRAEAVGPSDWQAGAIITDNLFYDNTSMSVEQVQAFLDGKVTTCAAGYTCLKSYVENPSTKANNIGGAAVEGGWTSAQIIKYAADTSRISPRSLLVLLQKESGLVMKTSPTATTYRTATGYGCPDTAPCDAQYYGFYNQVTQAAAAFRRYADNPTNYRYRAGTTTAVYWHPDLERCGSQNVTIQNKATAGLYIYTPYQPNAAALAAYPGTGDSCSSYGNRNFWYLWNNWFGSTGAPPPSNGGQPIVHPDGGRCIDVPQSTTSLSTQVQLYDCGGASAQQWKLTAASELRVYGSPERCLDVRGGNLAAGTPVQIYECNGTAPQRWSVNADGTITSQGFCLDAAAAGTANGTKLVIYTCNGTGAQEWAGPVVANGGKAVQQVASGRCLSVPGPTTMPGTVVQVADCNGAADQQWIGSTASELRVYANECLQVRDAAYAAGRPVQLAACDGTAAQKWAVNAEGTITSQGFCLDTVGGGTASGTRLEIDACSGAMSQRWVGPAIAGGGVGMVHPDGGRCIDVPGGTTMLGTQVQLWDCNGSAAQQWQYTSASQLRVYRNECLDVRGGNFAAGSAVQIWECNGSASQRWAVNANGTITIRGFCLDAAGAGTSNGTRLGIHPCNGTAAQRWSGPPSLLQASLLHPYGGRCIDVPGSSSRPGTSPQLWDCNSSAAQTWALSGAAELRVFAATTPRCLDVQGGSFAAGASVQIWECNGSAAQKWATNADGSVTIRGWCLDAQGNGSANGTRLQLWSCNGSAAQRWIWHAT